MHRLVNISIWSSARTVIIRSIVRPSRCFQQQQQQPIYLLFLQQHRHQQIRTYNPNQRKPSNKKKKRKLKRKARKRVHQEHRKQLVESQPGKIQRLTLLSLPYPVKLRRVIAIVDTWYDNLAVDFAFRETLLQNEGWFPIQFAANRLVEWTNHGILVNSFAHVPDRYDMDCLYSIDGGGGDGTEEEGEEAVTATLPPVPDSFMDDVARWDGYEYDEEDFHEDEWFDLQTDLDALIAKIRLVDDRNDYDARFRRYDYPLDRIRQIDDEANRQSSEVLRRYPSHFGTDEERNPQFGYDGFGSTTTVTMTATPAPSMISASTSQPPPPATTTAATRITSPRDVFSELHRILSNRKK